MQLEEQKEKQCGLEGDFKSYVVIWYDVCYPFLFDFQGGKTTTEAQQQAFGQGELNNPVWQDKPTAMDMLHLLDFSMCAQWKKKKADLSDSILTTTQCNYCYVCSISARF